MVVLETALPAKFEDALVEALGEVHQDQLASMALKIYRKSSP